MATNENVTINTGLTVLRSGIVDSSGTACRVYVVLERRECERKMKETFVRAMLRYGNAYTAERLTGWRRSERGPGRAFAESPYVLFCGRKVLIVQRRGLDV